MTLVYVFGSGECEQLGLGDDQPFEIKKPRKPEVFDVGNAFPSRSVTKIICGGMHTVALTNKGTVYTWGCNDEGALGRDGAENTPLQVDESLPPVTDISAGDSHTIAFNKNTNQLYYWGCYRNAQTGKTFCRQDKPQQLAQTLFNTNSKLRIKKVASGSHHTLLLTECGKVYGWGDAESGKIGRMLATRNKNNQALKIEPLGAKNAIDIFCGNQHSFYINNKHHLYAWGLNNHGQLGLGNKNNCSVPTRVTGLNPYKDDTMESEDYVVEVAGGEHHSIARTKRGVVYAWGRNDEGQVGQGDTYGEYRKQKAKEALVKQEEAEAIKQAEEAKIAVAQQAQPAIDGVNPTDIQPSTGAAPDSDNQVQPVTETNEKKKPIKKTKPVRAKAEKEEDLKNIYYFYRPQLVEDLWKWELEEGDDQKSLQKPCQQIAASGQYCYAVCGDEVYSWGMGENYVLGNRQDDNEFLPYKLDPRMFENNKVIMMGLGTQHAVALTHDGSGDSIPEVDIAQNGHVQSAQPSKPSTPAGPPKQTGKVAPKSATPAKLSQQNQPAAQEDEAQAEPAEQQSPVKADAQPEIDPPVSESKKRTHEEFQADQEENAEEQGQPEKRLKVEEEPEAVVVSADGKNYESSEEEAQPQPITQTAAIESSQNNVPNDS